MEWLECAGLYPGDIRARSFRLHLSPSLRSLAVTKPERVCFRARYSCSGACTRLAGTSRNRPSENTTFAQGMLAYGVHSHSRAKPTLGQNLYSADSDTTESDSEYDLLSSSTPADAAQSLETPSCQRRIWDNTSVISHSDEELEEQTSERPKRKKHSSRRSSCRQKCPYQAEVIVEITLRSAILNRCHILSLPLPLHPIPRHDVIRTGLQISPNIRRMLASAAEGFNMTEMGLKAWYENSQIPYIQWARQNCSWRCPERYNEPTWRSVIRTTQSQHRLCSDPVAAIEAVYLQDPDAFIAVEYPAVLRPSANSPANLSDCRFQCVLATSTSLLRGMMYAEDNGGSMDSCWRNMNTSGSPATLFATIGGTHYGLPIAMAISNYSDTKMYRFLLRAIREAIEQLAKKIVDEDFRGFELHGFNIEDVVERSKEVITRGWRPLYIMIDGDTAERNAIELELPGVPIQMCIFHFLQALRPKAREYFGGPCIPSETRDRRVDLFLNLIREVLRCPDEEEWPRYWNKLEYDCMEIRDNDRSC